MPSANGVIESATRHRNRSAITDHRRTADPARNAGRMRYALCSTSRMSIRHGSTTFPTVSRSPRPHASWRRYARLTLPNWTASSLHAGSGVTEATRNTPRGVRQALTWRFLGGSLAVPWRFPGGSLAVPWRPLGRYGAVRRSILTPDCRATRLARHAVKIVIKGQVRPHGELRAPLTGLPQSSTGPAMRPNRLGQGASGRPVERSCRPSSRDSARHRTAPKIADRAASALLDRHHSLLSPRSAVLRHHPVDVAAHLSVLRLSSVQELSPARIRWHGVPEQAEQEVRVTQRSPRITTSATSREGGSF